MKNYGLKLSVFVFILLRILGNVVQAQPAGYSSKEVLRYDENMASNYRQSKIYRLEGAKEKTLITQNLYRAFRDGHYYEYEVGDFEWQDSSLTLWNYWNFHGQDNAAAFGARKMEYRVQSDGKLYLVEAKIYLEEGPRDEGAMFLHEKDLRPEDHAKLIAYVRRVQADHKSTFVYGHEADRLIAAARERLATQIQAAKKRQ